MHYFKQKYKIVDRHIDKFTVAPHSEDKENLDNAVAIFRTEQIPQINKFERNKVNIYFVSIRTRNADENFVFRFGMLTKCH